jgi:hypothetical protein
VISLAFEPRQDEYLYSFEIGPFRAKTGTAISILETRLH